MVLVSLYTNRKVGKRVPVSIKQGGWFIKNSIHGWPLAHIQALKHISRMYNFFTNPTLEKDPDRERQTESQRDKRTRDVVDGRIFA